MVVLAVLVSATISYAPRSVCQFLVVCGYHATVPAYSHVLCGIEREASGIPDRPDLSSFEFGSMCLASILNHVDACLSCEIAEFINSRWMPVKMHWHQCSRPRTYFCSGRARTQVYS